MRIDPESLAKASSRHPWRVVTIWAVFLVAGVASAAALLGPALTTDFNFTNVPEAKRAIQILEDRNLSEDVISETFVVAGEPGAIEDAAFARCLPVHGHHMRHHPGSVGRRPSKALPAASASTGPRRSTASTGRWSATWPML